MQVTNQLNNQTNRHQNFTSVNLIQVAVGAKEFQGKSPLQIEKLFARRTRKAMTGLPNFVAVFWQRLCHLPEKAELYLESPYYARIVNAYRRIARKHPLDNFFPPLKQPKDRDFHSFYLYTGKQADAIGRFSDVETPEVAHAKAQAESKYGYMGGPLKKDYLSKIQLVREKMAYFLAILDPVVEKRAAAVSKGQEIHTFKIGDLSELPEVLAQIKNIDEGQHARCTLSVVS